MARQRGRRRSRVVLAALGIAALLASACSSGRGPIRYGSLVAGERTFQYRHGVESFTLRNGLVVALLPDAHANLVSVDVRYRAGAAADPAGKTGLAHLVEHLTFTQPGGPGRPALHDQLALAALRHNASTTWDATHYQGVALAEKLDELLAIEAARMTRGCAGLDPAAIDHERAVVAQELAQRGARPLLDAVIGDLFGEQHRYAAGVGGRDLVRLTLDDVCGFLEAHYAPDRAILVVAGRFDRDAVRRAVAEQFGDIPRRPGASASAAGGLALTGTTSEYRVDAADSDEAAALVVFPAAPWGSPAAFDDDLLDQLLVGGLARLERQERWVTGVTAGRLGGELDGVRYFGLSVSEPARLDHAIAEVFRIAGGLPGPDSGLALGVIAARRRADLFSDFESVFERGDRCADYLQFTRHGAFHLPELAALQEIDTDRLALRARLLTRDQSHVVKVLPGAVRGSGAGESVRSVLPTAAAVDVPVWRAPVDPAEADRPLELPAPRAPRALRELRLANGLRVVMAADFAQPVLEARLVFPVGAFNAAPAGPAVVEAAAALLEHDAWVPTLRDFTILDWVLRLGSQLSYDVDEATTFTVRGSATFADWHVWRLHWLLENGTYDGDDVKRARASASARAARDDPDRRWQRALREALFGRGHPYVRADGDTRIRARELQAFRDERYRAGGATLIVVGQFDPDAMTRTVTELFGAWSSEPPPAPVPVPAMRPLAGPTWLAHDEPDADQLRIILAFAATSRREAARGARAIVIEMVRSRLEEVRTRLGASYGLGAAYELTQAGDALHVTGRVDADRGGEVVQLIQRQLDGLRTGDDELAADFVRARRVVLARALADPGMSSTVAGELESAITRGRALDAAATLPATIAATTLRDARAVIDADLRPLRMVGLLGGRPAAVAAAFAAVRVTPVRLADSASPVGR